MRYLQYISMLLIAVMYGGSMAMAEGETVYGRDLMTQQERAEHRRNMSTMTAAEREQYRIEQHERMKKRAAEQGKVIPDEVGERGKMRQGQGMGQGRGGMGGGGMGRR